MKKHVCSSLILLVVTLSVLATARTVPPGQASPDITMWVDPPLVNKTSNEVAIGDWFLVYVYVQSSDPWALMMFQAAIRYDLRCLAPSMQDDDIIAYPSWRFGREPYPPIGIQYVFSIYPPDTIANPSLVHVNSTTDAIMVGETQMQERSLTGGQTYYLACFNFTIIAKPAENETLECPLCISNDGTFLYNIGGPVIVGPGPNIIDGLYRMVWTPQVHDVAITNVAPEKTVVGNGYSCLVKITVANEGDFTETFNATVFVNASAMIAVPISNLLNKTATVLNFIWNTEGYANGNYTVTVTADAVTGETETADNNSTDTFIYVAIPGDVDGSSKVNMLDLYNIALHYGRHAPYGSPHIANCDIDDNDVINMIDLYIAAIHYGQTEPPPAPSWDFGLGAHLGYGKSLYVDGATDALYVAYVDTLAPRWQNHLRAFSLSSRTWTGPYVFGEGASNDAHYVPSVGRLTNGSLVFFRGLRK